MPRQYQSGFTLVELMIAVAVMVILAMLAVPSFTTYMEKSRLRGAADDVVNLIAQARQAGVKYDRVVNLAVEGNGNVWCLGANEQGAPASVGDPLPPAADCDCTEADECMVDNQRLVVGSTEHAGISLSNPPASLTFDGRMGIEKEGDSDSIDLTSQNGRYAVTINISPLGQATVCSTTGNILGYPEC